MKRPPTEPQDLPAPVQEEEALLDVVRTHLTERPQGPAVSEQEAVAEMTWLRHEMARAKEEDLGSLFQQYDQLAHRVRHLREGRKQIPLDPECPYFAHLRVGDSRGERDLLLGRATRLEDGLRIVDWRNAPISSIFYRYQEGEEFEEQSGEVTMAGRVLVRRTVGIQGGHLFRVDAPQGTWVREVEGWSPLERGVPSLLGGSGTATRGHTRPSADLRLGTGQRHRADKHLPEIAALIDPHQFDLITGPCSGLVGVRGSAGSGKTTVALHRIAWLAWADPARFRPGSMMVMVWGKALKNYVSHVLPSLGVDGVQVVTWADWARNTRIRHFPRLPHPAREDTPASTSRLKLHPRLPALLRGRIKGRPAPPTAREALDDFVSLLADGPAVARELAKPADDAFLPGQVEQAGQQLLEQATLLRSWLRGERDEPAILDPEDDAILLRCWQERVGPLRLGRRGKAPPSFSHVVVDEVQDFSPMELKVVLGCLDEGRCATLAGDTAQHIMEHKGFRTWDELFDLLDLDGVVVETLRVSYRSTVEIASFARSLLDTTWQEDEGELRATRTGPPVEVLRFTDHGAVVAFLADALRDLARREPLASVALVAPNPDVARMYHEGLHRAELPRLRLVLDQDFAFAPGVEVTLVQDVKGLEFDYVVMLEAATRYYPDAPIPRHQLHVAATRAIHQLWVTSVETPAAPIRHLV